MAKIKPVHILIVEARFYDDMADALLDGAKHALDAAGATYDIVRFGALEIPRRSPGRSTAPTKAGRNMTASFALAW